MLVAELVGNVWATRKLDSLNGLKFMLVEVVGGPEAGRRLVAVDTIGAGFGDRVLVCTGSSARRMFDNHDIPVDAAIVGIIDADCNISGEN
ncbi:MAG: EutN/CcmL family microcompartment protein [Desulfobacterales bacterium]|nr:EutN/CcmL family microcompartment protein [Desulfobacterales bacterium]